jgi:hypothetical protein
MGRGPSVERASAGPFSRSNVTFADGVLRLVRAGARIEPQEGMDVAPQPAGSGIPPQPSPAASRELLEALQATEAAADELIEFEPGMDDLEAAVAIVEAGLASRVVLAGFPSWPGLLWRAYQLAETADVTILPTVVRPGGKVDIVIARASTADG